MWMFSVWNMSVFRIFQNCQCATVLNSLVYREFTYFRQYERILNTRTIIEVFWIFQDCKHARTANLHVCKDYTRLWIWLNKLFWLWQGSEYASVKFNRILNMSSEYGRIWNQAKLWICQAYMGFWTCLSKPEYVWMITFRIWQNPECVWCNT